MFLEKRYLRWTPKTGPVAKIEKTAGGVPAATEADVVAQFQTCVVADGSVDRILDVVDA